MSVRVFVMTTTKGSVRENHAVESALAKTPAGWWS
jgi:hypothetical protein